MADHLKQWAALAAAAAAAAASGETGELASAVWAAVQPLLPPAAREAFGGSGDDLGFNSGTLVAAAEELLETSKADLGPDGSQYSDSSGGIRGGVTAGQRAAVKAVSALLRTAWPANLPLSVENYAARFRALLTLEEEQMERDIGQYTLHNVELRPHPGVQDCVRLDVKGVAEQRPHLAFGDKIYLRLAQRDALPLPGCLVEWEGRVVDVTHTTVTVRLPLIPPPRHCDMCANAAVLRGDALPTVDISVDIVRHPEFVAVVGECGHELCTGCCRRVAAANLARADADRKRDGRRPAELVGSIGCPVCAATQLGPGRQVTAGGQGPAAATTGGFRVGFLDFEHSDIVGARLPRTNVMGGARQPNSLDFGSSGRLPLETAARHVGRLSTRSELLASTDPKGKGKGKGKGGGKGGGKGKGQGEGLTRNNRFHVRFALNRLPLRCPATKSPNSLLPSVPAAKHAGAGADTCTGH